MAHRCQGSLSTGSPAGHLNVADADEAAAHGGSMYSQAHVSPRRSNKAPRGEHGLGTKAIHEKWCAPNPEGGTVASGWVPAPRGVILGRRRAHHLCHQVSSVSAGASHCAGCPAGLDSPCAVCSGALVALTSPTCNTARWRHPDQVPWKGSSPGGSQPTLW